MDPVTTAIVAALTAGVIGGTTEVGKKVVLEAYGALKALLENKFGARSELVKAVKSLENRPDSAGRKTMVREEVATAKADQDSDVLAAAQALLDKIKEQPGGEQHVQMAIGSYIAQADRGGTATVTINQPKE
jgi:hypothetical protein